MTIQQEKSLDNLKSKLENHTISDWEASYFVFINDYTTNKKYTIFDDGKIIDEPLVIEKHTNKLLIGTGIMIAVYLILAIIFAALDCEGMIWTVIILGIINLFLFRFSWD